MLIFSSTEAADVPATASADSHSRTRLLDRHLATDDRTTHLLERPLVNGERSSDRQERHLVSEELQRHELEQILGLLVH